MRWWLRALVGVACWATACTPTTAEVEAPRAAIAPKPSPPTERWLAPLLARIGAADYLAVGAAAHRDALAPLLAHRRAQGHEAAFLAIEELAATGPAWSERLRELVVAAHASAGNLRYLLLVGDVDGEAAIPTFDE